MLPCFMGKKYSELENYRENSDFKDFNVDAWTVAAISSNNNLKAVQALFACCATEPAALELRKIFESKKETVATNLMRQVL